MGIRGDVVLGEVKDSVERGRGCNMKGGVDRILRGPLVRVG